MNPHIRDALLHPRSWFRPTPLGFVPLSNRSSCICEFDCSIPIWWFTESGPTWALFRRATQKLKSLISFSPTLLLGHCCMLAVYLQATSVGSEVQGHGGVLPRGHIGDGSRYQRDLLQAVPHFLEQDGYDRFLATPNPTK